MEEVVTFVSSCGRFKLTVKKEYTLKYDITSPLIDQFKNNNINNYLHNPEGPALVHLKPEPGTSADDIELYWLNGKPIKGEELKKLKHNFSFNNTVEKLINEDEE